MQEGGVRRKNPFHYKTEERFISKTKPQLCGEEGEAQETMCWDQACDKGTEEKINGAHRAGLCPVPPHFSEQQRWSNNQWTVTVFSCKILYVLSKMAGRRGEG